ncbi:MAG: hypothetical protein ACERKO_11970, partial [Acetanaerobacterium sp.]
MKHPFKRAVALTVAAVMTGAIPVWASAAQPTVQPAKEEVVYVKLSADGAVESAYVVNSFELQSDGQFVDYGRYDEVHNLSTTDQLSAARGAVNISAPKGRFYYQGNLKTVKLPWTVAVHYVLDDKPISAREAAGATGQLEIVLDIDEAPDANPVFTENYSLQVAITLDTERCSGIEAPDATVAAAGGNKVINFVKLPGGGAQYHVSMKAADFEMDGIQISAVPFSMTIDLPDTGDMTGDITKLQDGIRELNDATWELADGGGDLLEGMGEFDDGLFDMRKGMNELDDGFGELVENNSELRSGSRDILKALSQIKEGLAGLDAVDLTALTQLAEGSSEILAGIQGLSGGLTQLQESVGQSADLQSANKHAIEGIEQQIEALNPEEDIDQITQLAGTKGLLEQNNMFIAGMQQGISGDGTPDNPGLAAGASALATQYIEFDTGIQGLPAMLAEMTGGMLELKDGIDGLVAGYADFDDGLKEYLSGTSKLYNGYGKLCNGFGDILSGSGDLTDGMEELHDGMLKLADGTDEMKNETGDMDSQMQEEIDKLMADYIVEDFTPVSFMSEKNTNVGLV